MFLTVRVLIVFLTGCSIPVVRKHGVLVDRVRFPAARTTETTAQPNPYLSLIMRWAYRLAAALSLTIGSVLIISLFTTTQVGSWYATLVKPPFTPPNWVFGPVWILLYVLMAIAFVRIWNITEGEKRRRWVTLFIVQLLLNIMWAILFFGTHTLLVSWVESAVLWFSVVMITADSWEIDNFAFWLLIPYLGWITFETLINISIWWIN